MSDTRPFDPALFEDTAIHPDTAQSNAQMIELLTGQPSESVRRLLAGSGTILRGAGGRSPFLRRWRARLATGRVAR